MAQYDLTPFMTGMDKGIQSGESLLSNIMKRKQAEEQMQLQKQREGRSAALFPLQKQLQELQLQKAQMDVDPQAQLNYFRQLQQGLIGRQAQGGDEPQDTDFSQIAQNPLLRGFFKKQFGIDPGAESPQQREQREVRTAGEKEQEKTDIKAGDELEKTAANLIPYIQNVDTIEEILNKKPNLTGLGTWLANKTRMTRDRDVGRFAAAAQNLQAMQAHKFGQRGGYGLAKLVESAKPAIGHAGAFNKGITEELKNNMLTSWNQIEKDYKRKTGKDLPYSIEGLFSDNKNIEPEQSGKQRGSKNMVTIRNPETGEVRRVTREEADKLIRSG